jgi:hypothetical protein
MIFGWTFLEFMEFLSYVATVIGIPLATVTYILQEKKERQNEQEEIYDKLMGHYTVIQEKLFEFPELDVHDKTLDNFEDARRQYILYQMVVSLFERSYILLASETDPAYQRMWNSWEDYIREWIRHPNFIAALPRLMEGEDKDFVSYMAELSKLPLKP